MPTKLDIADSDPFAAFTRPPANETSMERKAREAREAEEKRVSDRIDDELRKERMAMKKKKNVVCVLLLGQSESGTR
jgi:guanine nucleotide-binding protein alpha-1 subunit